jgi:replicative DNA helicase
MKNNTLELINELLNNSLIDNNEKSTLIKDLIIKQNIIENNILDLSEKTKDLFENYVEKYNNPNTVNDTIIKTGFISFENNLYGFNLGEVVVLASQPGMGKTQFMVNLVTNFAQKHHVQYFSFGQTKTSLLNRFIACISGIPTKNLMHNRLSNIEYDKLIASKSKIQDLNVFINDETQNSLSSFVNLCIDTITKKNVKIIVIDYLQLLTTYKYNEGEEIATIMCELKTLARVYNVSIFVLNQLNRFYKYRESDNDTQPILSDLKQYYAIEQVADKVIFLHRPEYYNKTEDEDGNSVVNMMEVIFAKNNIDKPFSVKLSINDDFTTFTDFN